MAKPKPKLVFLNKYASGARPDTIDFRDITYVPTLVKVPPSTSLDEYRKIGVPIWDQGQEGACTGFALATVANYLLRTLKERADKEDLVPVSPAMLYAMAK